MLDTLIAILDITWYQEYDSLTNDKSGGQMAYRLPVSLPKKLEEKLKDDNRKTGVPLAEIVRQLLKKKYNIK